jgi:hypothetical protein
VSDRCLGESTGPVLSGPYPKPENPGGWPTLLGVSGIGLIIYPGICPPLFQKVCPCEGPCQVLAEFRCNVADSFEGRFRENGACAAG